MKTIFSTVTLQTEAGSFPPDSELQLEDDEAERLIGLGAAIDPDQRIVVPDEAPSPTDTALRAERDALVAQLADATHANDEFMAANDAAHAQLETANGALQAAHAEIAALTAKLAEASKKK